MDEQALYQTRQSCGEGLTSCRFGATGKTGGRSTRSHCSRRQTCTAAVARTDHCSCSSGPYRGGAICQQRRPVRQQVISNDCGTRSIDQRKILTATAARSTAATMKPFMAGVVYRQESSCRRVGCVFKLRSVWDRAGAVQFKYQNVFNSTVIRKLSVMRMYQSCSLIRLRGILSTPDPLILAVQEPG